MLGKQPPYCRTFTLFWFGTALKLTNLFQVFITQGLSRYIAKWLMVDFQQLVKFLLRSRKRVPVKSRALFRRAFVEFIQKLRQRRMIRRRTLFEFIWFALRG